MLYSGFYNIAATHQHLRPTFWLLQIGLREAIERRARDIEAPPLDDPALFRRGAALYANIARSATAARVSRRRLSRWA